MQSGNAERVRHVEVDFEELAEVIGTHLELNLCELPKWPDVLASGDVWKCDTATRPDVSVTHHSEGQFGGAKSETGPFSCP